MTQPSILKGMRNLRDAQTSVMTTAPAQLGFVLERTSPTLYTLSVSIKKQLRFRKNWNLNWIEYFTCDQNVIFHILLWKGNEFCCNCGQRLPSNFHFLEQNYVERKPRLDPKEAYTLCKYWNELYGSEASFCVQGKKVDPCSSLRRMKWVHDHRGDWSLFATIFGWRTFNRKSSKWRA